jgi:hypothetical protein
VPWPSWRRRRSELAEATAQRDEARRDQLERWRRDTAAVAPDPEVRSPSAAVIEATQGAIIQAYGGGGNWINVGTVTRAVQPGDVVTVTGGSYARIMPAWTNSTTATFSYTYTPGSADIWISEQPANIYDEAQRRVEDEIRRRWDREFMHRQYGRAEDRWHRARQMGTFTVPDPDPEVVERERAAQAEQDRIQRERHQAERERAAAARTVATELLESWLDEAQRESYRRGDGIPVVGSAGTRFRIDTHGHVSNVRVLHPETGDEVDRVCAHPAMGGGLPLPDVHLAQMLAIMTNERDFLATANWDGHRLPYGDDGRLQIEPVFRPSQADVGFVDAQLAVEGRLRRAVMASRW